MHPGRQAGWGFGACGMPKRAIGFAQGLGDDLGVSDDRHKVGVPIPSRNKMQVKVSRYPCTCRTSQIESYVESIRLHDPFQSGHPILDEMEHFQPLGFFQSFQKTDMPVRGDHQVSVVVWVEIQQRECLDPSDQDLTGFVRLRLPFLTEQASRSTGRPLIGTDRCDVDLPPRSPQPIQTHEASSAIVWRESNFISCLIPTGSKSAADSIWSSQLGI